MRTPPEKLHPKKLEESRKALWSWGGGLAGVGGGTGRRDKLPPNRTVARLEASLDEKGVNYKKHDICIVAGV